MKVSETSEVSYSLNDTKYSLVNVNSKIIAVNALNKLPKDSVFRSTFNRRTHTMTYFLCIDNLKIPIFQTIRAEYDYLHYYKFILGCLLIEVNEIDGVNGVDYALSY